MDLDPIILLGKASLTTENERNVDEALAKRELIKVGVLKNCDDDPREIAETLAEHTRSEVVQVIGKKIVLYRQGKDKNRKIELPKARKKQ
jgi:RNA-binding protein